LVGSNQGNYFENATACSKRMRKTTVATQLQCCAVTDYKNISDLFPRFNTKERKNIEKGSAQRVFFKIRKSLDFTTGYKKLMQRCSNPYV